MADLTHSKLGWEDRKEATEPIAIRAQALKDKLLAAVDADMKAKLLARADAAWAKTKELHARADVEILGKLRADAG